MRKHASASTAVVSLTVTAHGTTLEITDDGSGFDTSAGSDGFGLSGMRDRLALVAGSLDISSSPAGTRLIVTLPAVHTPPVPTGSSTESRVE